jgi:hypothetical protein
MEFAVLPQERHEDRGLNQVPIGDGLLAVEETAARTWSLVTAGLYHCDAAGPNGGA